MRALSPVEQKFILHWWEMGTKWGINRTVAQIHALLHIASQPLNAEDIAGTLEVARSNVSNSLKELQSWRIVRLVHVMGDKRDHFEALPDVWDTFRIVLDECKRREMDPTLGMLRECIEQAKDDKQIGKHTEQKLRELADFFETTAGWYEQIRKWPTAGLKQFAKLGGKAGKLLGFRF